MKQLSRKQLQGLGTGLQLGGVIAQNLDADTVGLDDDLGKAFQVAGVALMQLSAGESVTKKAKVAAALRVVGSVCNAVADDVEAGKEVG